MKNELLKCLVQSRKKVKLSILDDLLHEFFLHSSFSIENLVLEKRVSKNETTQFKNYHNLNFEISINVISSLFRFFLKSFKKALHLAVICLIEIIKLLLFQWIANFVRRIKELIKPGKICLGYKRYKITFNPRPDKKKVWKRNLILRATPLYPTIPQIYMSQTPNIDHSIWS